MIKYKILHYFHLLFNVAKLVVHKTRLEKIFNVLSPSRICIQFLFVAMATVCGMCLSNLEGHNIWTYPNRSVSMVEILLYDFIPFPYNAFHFKYLISK